MNILFIQPNPRLHGIGKHSSSFFERLIMKFHLLCPRLTFPMLAALTPENHSITFVDERFEYIDFRKKYDLVGITAMTNEVIRAYELGDEFKKRNIPVVIGGPHVSALPEEAKNHADSIVIGEAEEIWPKLLNDAITNSLKPYYQQEEPSDLNKLPLPKRNLIERILLQNGIQTSRGCPHKCKYCFIGNSPESNLFRKRSIDSVIQEIKGIPQKTIIFYDSSLTIDIDHTKSLFKSLKVLNKKLICLGNIDILKKDDELLRLSREAGCIQWNIGFESISQASLIDINKSNNRVEDYIKVIEKIHSYGMNVHGFFIFGFDHDTREIFNDTWQFLKESKIDSANFSILTPLPRTAIYDEFVNQGRILTKNWSLYGYQKRPVFRSKNLSEKEILDGYTWIYKNYFSWSEILLRFTYTFQRGISISKLVNFFLENIVTRSFYLNNVLSEK